MAWSYRKTEIEKCPAGVLIDDRFRHSSPIRELPHLAAFLVHCRRDPGAAFWAPEETEALDQIERDLIRLCDQFGRGWAVYVKRIDTHGLRSHYIYHGDSAELGGVGPALQAAYPAYQIEAPVTYDSRWSVYCRYLPTGAPAV